MKLTKGVEMKNKVVISIICVVVVIGASIGLYLGLRNTNDKPVNSVTITDMVGDTVTVKKNASKVAVLARSAVDMLVAFGLGEKVDGVYYTVLNNEWAKTIYPHSENYFAYDYDTTVETYLARGVDLVIAPEKYIADNLREHGITAFTVSQYGTPNYDDSVFAFAEIIKKIWEGNEIKTKINEWENEFTAIKDEIILKLATIQTTQSLYYVRGDKNKGIRYTENSEKTIQNTIAKYLKLNYVSKDFTSSEPTAEVLLSTNPDYIFVGGAFQNTIINNIRTDSIWSGLSAVTNDKIFNIGVGFVMFEQNGVELSIYLADMANKIYPDKFNFDITQMLKDSMQKYFGKTISDNDATNMLNGKKANGENLA
ncbi:MAG: ABC transporter substrate-binding protein [Clostridiales bacterium]|jgi:iron complex transport system substrate-binding protein|nr:ABC transporter substrate-binding protein [Clostridiales bacterium]